MKKRVFKVPVIGDVEVTLIQVEGKEDEESVMKILKRVKYDDKAGIDYIRDNIKNENYDGGDTLYCMNIRKIVVVFFIFTCEEEREAVYGHEKRHIEDRILKYFSIDDIETNALLAGFLSKQFYKFKQLK